MKLTFNAASGTITDEDNNLVVAFVSRAAHERYPDLGLQLAAAPDLLAELQRCVADLSAKADRFGSIGLIDDADDLRITRSLAEEIIAKAEGPARAETTNDPYEKEDYEHAAKLGIM